MATLQSTPRTRTLTAFFDERAAAQKAVDDLVASGLPSEDIRLTEGSGTTAVEEDAKPTAQKGFWDELKDLFLPDPERHSYAEGLSRGGYLLSVNVDQNGYDRALDILDAEGAVDMDSREAEWTAGGWNGWPTPAPSVVPGVMGESDLMGDVAATPGASRMARDTEGQRLRLRSFSVQNDLASGFPSDRRDGLPTAGVPDAAAVRSRITEHMDVIAADGTKIGTVDHMDGPDRIKLTKNSSPDGQHHLVPLTWVDHVDAHVHLNRSLADIKARQEN